MSGCASWPRTRVKKILAGMNVTGFLDNVVNPPN